MRFQLSAPDLIGAGVVFFAFGLGVGLLRLLGFSRTQALYLALALTGFALWSIARHLLRKGT